jgi:hypothetical protein
MGTFENRVSGDGEPAILAVSDKYTGIWGESIAGGSGVYGRSPGWHGVFGESDTNTGVLGQSNTLFGVHGVSTSSTGTIGQSESGFGVHGTSKSSTGIVGQSVSGVAIEGASQQSDGVVGRGNRGVVGISENYQGVFGWSRGNSGVVGESEGSHAVFAITRNATSAGIFATNSAGGNAALFEGNVTVTGDLFLAGADVAEEFPVVDDLPPGTVAVLDGEGNLTPCQQPYDTRVAGIISGAGDRVPALVLDRVIGTGARRPLAVTGKAWCAADAREHPIEVGDLLTTAAEPGKAMRVTDRLQAVGAIIGKALTPLRAGQGPVLVLVGLG